ncbi:phosphate signaling complex protein PhoU [Cohnella luojiensis]|uniref:Phosphate-specific transport system accessory protein PhoU n=1 Tax=Cohnella luojiensis TaxID=652876 RepID=A0A4Y8M5G9_9BACL|nr:phosphate signaling complex protein PhoU [Cohnella luojiensis]TFE30890.1 phosphate signaling complex protein PhoU [Cohnella luojiensis]
MVKRKEFDQDLDEITTLLTQMGDLVSRALIDSMEALSNVDSENANRIIQEDQEINLKEETIFEIGSRLIVTQQPVAKDLRRILMGFKISSDMERMGDLSVDIAKVVVRLKGQTLIKPLIDLPRMAEIASGMIQDSIQCFIHENVDLAYKMAKDDDQVDTLFSQIFNDLNAIMGDNPQTVHQSMLLCFVARYIERIADYATNIGENVVYLVTGSRPDLN